MNHSLREALKHERPVLGTLVGECLVPNIAGMLASAGFDAILLDMEHGLVDWQTLAAIVSVGNGLGTHMMVRVADATEEAIGKSLNAGAAGIMVPQVHDADRAKRVVEHAKYPPVGRRGLALRRAHHQWRPGNAEQHMAHANAAVAVIVEIESQAALACIDRIASTDGVDVLYIGPYDLSIDLGVPGNLGHPKVRDAYRQVQAAAREAGCSVGSHAGTVERAQELIDMGFDLVTYGSDVAFVVDSGGNALNSLRGAKGNAG